MTAGALAPRRVFTGNRQQYPLTSDMVWQQLAPQALPFAPVTMAPFQLGPPHVQDL